MSDDEMVEVTRSLEKYYKNYTIYMRSPDGKGYLLYKQKGVPIEALRIKEKRHPEKLYITLQDKIKEVTAFQRRYNAQLRKEIKNNPAAAKALLWKTMEVSLAEPRTQILHNIKETIDIVVDEYLESPSVAASLLEVSAKDYSAAVHSVNVMLFCLGLGHFSDLSVEDIKLLGLMGLLHDVGKIKVPEEILKAQRELNVRETKLFRRHTEHGYRIIKDGQLDLKVALSALEHHERRDGSGYPDGKLGNEILPQSAMVGIIDAFEQKTSCRPGQTPLKPIEALTAIREEVDAGKFDPDIFKNFARSIVGMH